MRYISPWVYLVVLSLSGGAVRAFAPTATRSMMPMAAASTTTTHLNLDASELGSEQLQARTDFFIWLFGASGAAGVARSAFPRMFNNIREIQSYRNVPGLSTADGAAQMVGISPLCGYPRDLTVKEMNTVLKNRLNIEQIVAKYPVENNIWAKKGYITYSAFKQANTKADPLVVRAIFDCFSQSTEVSSPDIAQQKMDSYKESLDNFKRDLLKSKVTGWAAIVTLLGLLGLADIEAYSKWIMNPSWMHWLDCNLTYHLFLLLCVRRLCVYWVVPRLAGRSSVVGRRPS